MKRILCLLLVIPALLAWSAFVGAATIKVKVLDGQTKEALRSYGWMEAYKKQKGSGWTYANSVYLTTPETDFTLSNLEAGTYYFVFKVDNYIAEYFNNTRNFNKKKEIKLSTEQALDLKTVYLNILPIRLGNPSLSVSDLPSSGGEVISACDVVNETNQAKRVRVWPNVTVQRTLYGATTVSGSFDVPGKLVDVPPRSTKTVKFTINVPAEAPGGPNYHYVRFFISEDGSKWKILAPPLNGGIFYKAVK